MYGYPGLGEGCRVLTPPVTLFPRIQNSSSRGDSLSLGCTSPQVPLRALVFPVPLFSAGGALIFRACLFGFCFSPVQGSQGSLNSVLVLIPAKRIWASSLWFFRFSFALCSLSSFLIFSANSLSSRRIHSSQSSGVSLLLNTFSAAFIKSVLSVLPIPLSFVISS